MSAATQLGGLPGCGQVPLGGTKTLRVAPMGGGGVLGGGGPAGGRWRAGGRWAFGRRWRAGQQRLGGAKTFGVAPLGGGHGAGVHGLRLMGCGSVVIKGERLSAVGHVPGGWLRMGWGSVVRG